MVDAGHKHHQAQHLEEKVVGAPWGRALHEGSNHAGLEKHQNHNVKCHDLTRNIKNLDIELASNWWQLIDM